MSTDLYDAFRQGELFLRAGQPTEAARLVQPVVEAEPANAAALELFARALLHSAQLVRAEAALRQLVELQPDDGWARFALARAMERQGKDASEHRRLAAALGFDA
ncbi:MAG: hypothetical protein JWM62_1265 [Frankiales bacterium]|jgi:predicted Zn-dependent protease|nr:hypothetical protein [Frankiales bacterium]